MTISYQVLASVGRRSAHVIGPVDVERAAAVGVCNAVVPDGQEAVVLLPACFYSTSFFDNVMASSWQALRPSGSLMVYGYSWAERRQQIVKFVTSVGAPFFTVLGDDGLCVSVKPSTAPADMVELLSKVDGGVHSQWYERARVYYALGAFLRPKAILEVGVLRGYAGAALSLGSGIGTTYTGVDNGVESDILSVVPRIFKACGCQDPNLLISDSLSASVPGQFDIVHLDCRHDENGVYEEAMKYWPSVARGGVLLIDDWLQSSVRYGVYRFVKKVPEVSMLLIDTVTGLCLLSDQGR